MKGFISWPLLLVLSLSVLLVAATPEEHKQSAKAATEHANGLSRPQGRYDIKFWSGLPIPPISSFGAGFGGALGFCQGGFLPFVNGAIGSFGPGLQIQYVTILLQRLVARFTMLVSYIQAMPCFICGIPNPQIVLFTQLAVKLFIRMQTLLSLVTQFYTSAIAQVSLLMSPLNAGIPSFFSMTNSIGFSGALFGSRLFNPGPWSACGVTSIVSACGSICGGVGGFGGGFGRFGGGFGAFGGGFAGGIAGIGGIPPIRRA